ncbi:hypothetical protein [Teredinibacter sp. KSP-S5-2]|uniref:hypothetical protein n=1 Tax=Teredinibacter sp. KSP-S5-2 TaxID=3034506 RepID=UPI002934BE20|nr:hypothetical protein [Teredinibacter sp. KSP-S5-2]WNO07958.1 hypothetical protein P5V12_13320 [Teredinibacter sp. KSP-S5-2]
MKIIISVIVLLFSVSLNAAEFTGTVKGFLVHSSKVAYVTLEKGNTSPSCDLANGWQFQFDPTSEHGKQWVSMLLASRMSKMEIIAGYNPNTSGNCTPTYFYYYDY